MLPFTIRMMLMDIQAVFKGLWAFAYLGMVFCLISLFFLIDDPFSFLYVAIMILSFLVPQLPKMFYVLPFDDKLIRRYLHLRGVLTGFLLLAIGGCITLLSLIEPVPYPEQGWRILVIFIHISLLMGTLHVKAPKRRTRFLLILLILLLLINIILAVVVRSFVLYLQISSIILILTDLLMSIVLRSVQLRDYVEPIYGYFNYHKRVRQDIQEGGPRA